MNHTNGHSLSSKNKWNHEITIILKVTKRITEMIALDSQLFSIVEDTGFLRLLVHGTLHHHEVFLRKNYT